MHTTHPTKHPVPFWMHLRRQAAPAHGSPLPTTFRTAAPPARQAAQALAHIIARVARRAWQALVRHSLRIEIALHNRRYRKYRTLRERAGTLERMALFDRALVQSRLHRLQSAVDTKEAP